MKRKIFRNAVIILLFFVLVVPLFAGGRKEHRDSEQAETQKDTTETEETIKEKESDEKPKQSERDKRSQQPSGSQKAPQSTPSPENQSITIYYTAHVNGNLDGCNCGGHPRSGLVKSAHYLRQRNKTDSLLIDGGDLMSADEDPLLDQYILDAYRDIGYDLIAVGDQEFTNGVESFSQYDLQFSFYSNNLIFRNTEGSFAYLSEDLKLFHRNNRAIAIIAITDPKIFRFYPDTIRASVKVLDPVQQLEKMQQRVNEIEVDMVVLLFHGYYSHLKEMSDTLKQFDVILLAHEQLLLEGEKVGNIPIFSPGPSGNRVGKLTCTFTEGVSFSHEFIGFDYERSPDDRFVRKKVDTYYEKLTSGIKTGNE